MEHPIHLTTFRTDQELSQFQRLICALRRFGSASYSYRGSRTPIQSNQNRPWLQQGFNGTGWFLHGMIVDSTSEDPSPFACGFYRPWSQIQASYQQLASRYHWSLLPASSPDDSEEEVIIAFVTSDPIVAQFARRFVISDAILQEYQATSVNGFFSNCIRFSRSETALADLAGQFQELNGGHAYSMNGARLSRMNSQPPPTRERESPGTRLLLTRDDEKTRALVKWLSQRDESHNWISTATKALELAPEGFLLYEQDPFMESRTCIVGSTTPSFVESYLLINLDSKRPIELCGHF